MPRQPRSFLSRYVCAVLSIALSIWLRRLLDPVLGDGYPFATVFLAVLVSAWYGGLRPALLAAALGALASNYFLMPPRGSFALIGPDQQMGLALYLGTALGISLLGGAMHSAALALREANALLESRIQQRTADLSQSNERLMASEERSRLIVEGVRSHAIFMLDPAGIVMTWHAGAERVQGYETAEIVGRHFSQFYPPEDIASGKPQRALQSALTQGSFEEEAIRVRKDGSRFWAMSTLTPLFDQSRQPIGFVDVTRDISESNEEKTARGEAEQRLAFALQRSRTGGWDLDSSDGTAHRTLEHDRIFGYETLLPKWTYELFLEHVLPEDRGEVDRRYQEAIATQSDWSFECRIRRADGEVRWIWATGGLQSDGKFPSKRFAGIVQDITERKQAEAAARLSEDRFRSIVEGSLQSIIIHQGDIIQYANPAAARIFGWGSTEELIGREVWETLTTPEEESHLRDRIKAAYRGEFLPTHPGWRAKRKDQSIIWVATTASRIEWNGLPAVASISIDVTEHRRAEWVLREQDERLRLAMQAARMGWWVSDLVTNETTFSDELGRILGLSGGGTMKRDTFLGVIHDSDRDRLESIFAVVVEKNVPFEAEFRVVWPAEGVHWLAIRGKLFHDEAGKPVRVVGVAMDITDRKLAVDALHASEERFRLLVEGVSGHAIFMLDPAGKVLTWNKEAERIDGYCSDEIIGKHYSCLFTPESIAEGLPHRELELAASEGKAEIEGWRIRKNGTRFWANGTLATLYDENHIVQGFAKVTRDLTAKRLNDELLHSVLDHTVDGIVGLDERGTVSMINRAGAILFDRLESEVVGQNVNMLLSEPFCSNPDGSLATYPRIDETRDFGKEVRGLRKNGSTFPIELAVTEFRLDNQRNFVGIVRDISERKKLEAQYQQSQKMEAFGQLAGGVAHDFNNLLTIISGYSELLFTMLPPEDAKRAMIGEIRHAGERAGSLTRQLLAFSRQQVLEPKILDLNAVVANIEKMLRRLIGEDVQFSTALRTTRSVKIDPGQIEQVIMNLAVNARDAMPRGGKLTIETSDCDLDESDTKVHPEVRSEKFVLLGIHDTGSGMTPEVKERIFEPFYTTKGVGRGTGLGLAVVDGIIKQSGGRIEVRSELGKGTTFEIYLPATQDKREDLLDPGRTFASRGTETILLVEDEDRVREFAVNALQEFGYTMLTASGGREALQIMANRPEKIDLLVTDVVMPDLSGRKLAETFQAQFPQLKVLFISGYTDDAIVRHGVLQSEVAFLQKPFTPSSLARKVREVLDHVS